MGWISSIFRKEKEIERVYIDLSELSEWFDERTEPIIDNIKDDVKAKFGEINNLIEKARISAAALEKASLRNENIPERALQIMQGNREAYIKSVNLFLNQLKTLNTVNFGNVQDFISRFEDNLNTFTKMSSKSYYILQEFFRNESAEIAQHIKKIDIIARSLLDNNYSRINTTRGKITKIDDFLKIKKRAEEIMGEEDANSKSINALYRETEDRIEKIKQSRDYKELQEIGKEKDKVGNDIKKNEAELLSLFSPIEKPMKKYSKITAESENVLKSYLESPLAGLLKDDHLRITDILAKMKEAVESNQLDLKDKKKEKALEALAGITKENLHEHAKRHYELVDAMEKLKKREGINTAAQKLNELNYKLTHLKEQLERSGSTISKIKKQMDGSQLSGLISDIENDAGDILSVKLKVRWQDGTAQKPA